MMLDQSTEHRLRANILEIERYTANYPALARAHHWLYDSRYPASGTPRYVVLGINPSETKEDWARYKIPTEDSSRFDYHDRCNLTRAAKNWKRNSEFALDGAHYVLAELFFWSSKDINKKHFRETFGPLERSPHLEFCTRLNKELIDAHQPKAVVALGISLSALFARLYGLTHKATLRSTKGDRVVERFTDGHRDWLIVRHWTGSRGFSNEHLDMIRAEVRGCSEPRT